MVLPGRRHEMSCFSCPEFICRSRFGHSALFMILAFRLLSAGPAWPLSVAPDPDPGPRAAGARPFEVPDRRSAPSGMMPASEPGSCAAGAVALGKGAVIRRRTASPPVGGRLRSSSLLPRRGAGPFSARILRGRGRVSAPARFAHLIARARQRAHLSRRLLTGFQKWRRPAARHPGRRLRSPLPWGPSYHNPPDVKPISGTKLINIRICSCYAKLKGQPLFQPFHLLKRLWMGPGWGSGATKVGSAAGSVRSRWRHSRRHHFPFGASAMTRRGG